MLDKNHVVDVPNGAIVRSNRIVLWTVGKNYIAAKQYNEDVRRMIGKTLRLIRARCIRTITSKSCSLTCMRRL